MYANSSECSGDNWLFWRYLSSLRTYEGIFAWRLITDKFKIICYVSLEFTIAFDACHDDSGCLIYIQKFYDISAAPAVRLATFSAIWV